MLERLREYGDRFGGGPPEEDNQPPTEFKALRVVAAQLLVLASVDVVLDSLGRARRARPGPPYPHGSPGPERNVYSVASTWAPTLVAPLAAAAQLNHALRPTPPAARATRVMNVAAIGVGVLGLIGSVLDGRRDRRPPSLSPLALASTGVLGLVLDREERDAAEARRRLERRAAVVSRLVPRRRARVDRIVVHV
jgi:hypothetical protein